MQRLALPLARQLAEEDARTQLEEIPVESTSEFPKLKPTDTLDAPQTGEIAVSGTEGKKADTLLESATLKGQRLLASLTRSALTRLLDGGDLWRARQLFTPDERQALSEGLASILAPAELLGRARIRRRVEPAEFADLDVFDDGAPKPMPPEKAAAYFGSLVPSVKNNPGRFGQEQRRKSFTLAVATEKGLLNRVKGVLVKSLESGEDTRATAAKVQELLDKAGVSPRNKGFSAMVVRTNLMDAYVTGQMEEIQDPDMAEFFPVWRYDGIQDGREGDDHRPHFGKYYPNSVAFAKVRGPRVYNCRCVPTAIDATDWEELQAQGAKVEPGYGPAVLPPARKKPKPPPTPTPAQPEPEPQPELDATGGMSREELEAMARVTGTDPTGLTTEELQQQVTDDLEQRAQAPIDVDEAPARRRALTPAERVKLDAAREKVKAAAGEAKAATAEAKKAARAQAKAEAALAKALAKETDLKQSVADAKKEASEAAKAAKKKAATAAEKKAAEKAAKAVDKIADKWQAARETTKEAKVAANQARKDATVATRQAVKAENVRGKAAEAVKKLEGKATPPPPKVKPPKEEPKPEPKQVKVAVPELKPPTPPVAVPYQPNLPASKEDPARPLPHPELDPAREPFVPQKFKQHGVSLDVGKNLYVSAGGAAGMSPKSAEAKFGGKQGLAELVQKGLLKREGNFVTGYEYRVTPQGKQVADDAVAAQQIAFKPPTSQEGLNDMTYRYLVAKDNDERKEILSYLGVPLKPNGDVPNEDELNQTLYQKILDRNNPVTIAEKLAASPHEAQRVRFVEQAKQIEEYQKKRQELGKRQLELMTAPLPPDAKARQKRTQELVDISNTLSSTPSSDLVARQNFEATFGIPAGKGVKYQVAVHDTKQEKPVNEALDFIAAHMPNDGRPRETVTTYYDPGDDRAHYNHADRKMNVHPAGETTQTVVHEMGHHIEYDNPEVHAAAMAFKEHRTKGEENKPMSDFGSGYKAREVGKDDDFARAFGGSKMRGRYAGKDYGTRSTEIVSMGLERMYEDPVAFARDDPEYFNFILGIMHGDTRMKPVPEK